MNRRRGLVLAALVALLALAYAFDLGRWLTLEAIRSRQAQLEALYAARPLAVVAGYFALYVALTAVSFPGATLLTLVGGALFGLGLGTLVVSFASAIGASLAFLASRYLLRDAVQRRFGARLAEIDRGIARDGAFYLFGLRLVPLVPFFVVNLALGLTGMRLATYHWVSQLGMLPGTLVYVNAGRELGALDSVRGILSPGLIASFTLLGLFPLVARKALAALQRRRAGAAWRARRPRRFDRNLLVIGGGAAGLVASYVAAAVKARVTLVEGRRLGGDCLYTGCVPSKALLQAARVAQQMRTAGAYGLAPCKPQVDFAAVMASVQRAVQAIEPHDSIERYTRLGVEVLQGHARLVTPWEAEVACHDGTRRRLSARAIVIATGAAPVVPDLPGLAEACVTSETVWGLRELPRRFVVLGGGAVGCELALAFRRLGSAVTLVEQAPRLLGREDDEVGDFARRALEAEGLELLLGHAALRCERGPDGARSLVVRDAAGLERALGFDALLCAVGRAPRLEGHGLEALGLLDAEGRLATDTRLRTRHPHILAAGDVVGPRQFTHAASHQAWHAAVNGLFGGWKSFEVDASLIPAVTFLDPEIASVGLNERTAREQGVAFEVTRFELAGLDRAVAEAATEGFVKVLTVPGRDRILGVTLVSRHAGEMLAEWVLAMKHGLGLDALLATIHAYPTWAEASKSVAGTWKREHAPQRLLRLLERFHAWRRGGG